MYTQRQVEKLVMERNLAFSLGEDTTIVSFELNQISYDLVLKAESAVRRGNGLK